VTPVADAHSDLLLELDHRRREDNPFARHWLPVLATGGVRLQTCAVFVEDASLPELALRQALRQTAAFHRALRENAGTTLLVTGRQQVDELAAGDRVGLMLSLEGAEPLGYDADVLDAFFGLGMRMISLTWNRRNAFADGTAEPASGGLSRAGRELVRRIADLPVVLDLAHANDRTFFDVLDVAPDRPVLVSHALCRAVCDTPRNLSDEQLRAIADRGGVVGLMAVPLVVHPTEWTIDRLVDHVDHLVEVVGIEHVCLGGDFARQIVAAGAIATAGLAPPPAAPGADAAATAFDAVVEGLAGPEDYPNLAAALDRRGYTPDQVAAICFENFVRVLRRELP
jgi:membrane dipeptidase